MGAPSPSPDAEGVPLGSVLDGRYRIDAVLGTGGMGTVYKGEHTSLGRAVAIKVLHADLTRNNEAAKRFQREALASGRLDHPNIVGVSDFGTLENGSLYLVMEALEGESVGERLDREGRIRWQDAVQITRSVLAGLRHAHDKGVVHRDIKPDNIFIARKDGEHVVKILDFGIAKLVQGTSDDPATTRAGLTVGTPAYLSPEQAVGGEITPASDVYSTSIVLYEMLAGRTPYDSKDPLTMLTAHVTREPPPFRESAPGVEIPPGLEEVVRHGLAKEKERRPSALEYMQRLEAIVRSAGLDVGPTGPISGITILPTPPPGALPSPLVATPMPFPSATLQQAAAMIAPPPPRRPAMTLAEITDPVPRKWIVGAVIVLVGAVVLAIAVLARGHGSTSATPATPAGAIPIPTPIPIDRDTQLKAALHDLEDGTTCADRKAAVAKLVDLGDDRAIPDLKRARYRMRGGVLGIGDSNDNACLKKDAERAIEALGGTLK